MAEVSRIRNRAELLSALSMIRRMLESGFDPDTAAAGFPPTTASAGHCAAVSAIIHILLGAEMVSARVQGLSHWFNRLYPFSEGLDFDLTGDQFGFPTVRVAEMGNLYSGTRHRSWTDLNDETIRRAKLLAGRAGFQGVYQVLNNGLPNSGSD